MKICQKCNKEYETSSKRSHYCGRECYLAIHTLPPEKASENLTILSFSHTQTKMRYWNVHCKICDKIKIMGDTSIRVSKSCGCERVCKGKRNTNWAGVGDLSATFFAEIKKHASRRKIEFNVTIEYLWNLYLKQDKKCALSGLDISFGESILKKEAKKSRYRINRILCTVSLDRIDSNIGYIEGNVQWVTKPVNLMKYTLSQTAFINMCKLIAENNK